MGLCPPFSFFFLLPETAFNLSLCIKRRHGDLSMESCSTSLVIEGMWVGGEWLPEPQNTPYSHFCLALIWDYFHSRKECTRKISHCTSLQFPSALFLNLQFNCSRLCSFWKPTWNTIEKLATARQTHSNSIWTGCFKLNLRQGGFCKPSDNGELCWRHRGWFSPFKCGHQIPAFSPCLVWGQTRFLKAFLNMSRGRNMTQGQRARSTHSSQNISIVQQFLSRYSFCVCEVLQKQIMTCGCQTCPTL